MKQLVILVLSHRQSSYFCDKYCRPCIGYFVPLNIRANEEIRFESRDINEGFVYAVSIPTPLADFKSLAFG